MNIEPSLPGIEADLAEKLSTRRWGTPEVEFEYLQRLVVSCLPDLKRLWHRAGQPAPHVKLEALFKSEEFLAPWENAPAQADLDDQDFQRLIEAMNQAHEADAKRNKRWKFSEIRVLMTQLDLFPHLRTPDLLDPQIRSLLGRLLERYVERVVQAAFGRAHLRSIGRNRTRVYELVYEGRAVVKTPRLGSRSRFPKAPPS